MVNSVFPKVKSDDVQVTWAWQDQDRGLIRWKFTNLTDKVQSFVLLRGAEAYNLKMDDSELMPPYYFGDAFYPIYLNYKLTSFATEQKPLVNSNVVTENVPPLGVIKIGDKYLVAFVFTLAPRESYEMLEGGYVKQGDVRIIPYSPVAVKVEATKPMEMCIGYNELAIIEYSSQIKEFVQGYSPNPRTFTSMVWVAKGPYTQIFPAPIYPGKCEMSPFGGLFKEFLKMIDQIIKDAEQDFEKAIHEFNYR